MNWLAFLIEVPLWQARYGVDGFVADVYLIYWL